MAAPESGCSRGSNQKWNQDTIYFLGPLAFHFHSRKALILLSVSQVSCLGLWPSLYTGLRWTTRLWAHPSTGSWERGGWEVGSDTLDILVLMLVKMTLPFSSGKIPQGCGTILGDHDPRVFRSWLCADKVKQTETVGREGKQLQSWFIYFFHCAFYASQFEILDGSWIRPRS